MWPLPRFLNETKFYHTISRKLGPTDLNDKRCSSIECATGSEGTKPHKVFNFKGAGFLGRSISGLTFGMKAPFTRSRPSTRTTTMTPTRTKKHPKGGSTPTTPTAPGKFIKRRIRRRHRRHGRAATLAAARKSTRRRRGTGRPSRASISSRSPSAAPWRGSFPA